MAFEKSLTGGIKRCADPTVGKSISGQRMLQEPGGDGEGHRGQQDERHRRETSLLGPVSTEGSLRLSLRPWEVDGDSQGRV